jgi:KDO2-lipid IV(A) lauroyltransferase
MGGGLCLAGHGGAWDLALVSAGFHVPITIFVREPTNRLAAWALARVRGRSDVELLPPRGSMSAAREALERGRLVVFVQDQRHNDGVEVPFFGRPALTSAGFAALAWRSRAPVFGAWQWWDGDGGHQLRFETLEPIFPETRDEAIVSLTRFSQAFYEDRIRERPHSWLWLHKRWKRGSEEQR